MSANDPEADIRLPLRQDCKIGRPMDTDDPEKPAAQDDTSADSQTSQLEVLKPPAHYDATKAGLPASSIDEVFAALVSDPKRYGAAVIFRFATAWAREQLARNRQAEERAEQEAKRARELAESNAEHRARIAELEGENRERRRTKPLVTLAFVLSPIIFGIGVDVVKSGHDAPGWGLIISAVGFLAVGVYVEYFKGAK